MEGVVEVNEISDFVSYIKSIEWGDPWLIALLSFHVVVTFMCFSTRNYGNFQIILFITLLLLQRTIYICGILYTNIIELYDHGGFMAVPVNADNDEFEEGTTSSEAEGAEHDQGTNATLQIGLGFASQLFSKVLIDLYGIQPLRFYKTISTTSGMT
ncbi:unnamed protein product [Leptosia nina]|uniref:Transmembrane protein 18 n=1 Tax=Leptosia nina TaxID=320188 RepID=A0AAV1JNC1_9NEOP